MTVPGSNLLRRAAALIRLQSISWIAWTGNTNNDAMVLVPTYAPPVTIQASVQAVSRAMYTLFGLDLSKNYLMVYTAQTLRDLERNKTCDQIDFDGRRYNVQSNTNWYGMDGWRASLLIDTGPTPP